MSSCRRVNLFCSYTSVELPSLFWMSHYSDFLRNSFIYMVTVSNKSRGDQFAEGSGFRGDRAWRSGGTAQYSREVKKRWSLKTVWE